jgi:hypothetical protein
MENNSEAVMGPQAHITIVQSSKKSKIKGEVQVLARCRIVVRNIIAHYCIVWFICGYNARRRPRLRRLFCASCTAKRCKVEIGSLCSFSPRLSSRAKSFFFGALQCLLSEPDFASIIFDISTESEKHQGNFHLRVHEMVLRGEFSSAHIA